MPEFDNLKPPANVTAPGVVPGAPFPAHLYQYVAAAADGSAPSDTAITVAWVGKMPIYNEYVVVGSEAEQVDLLAAGYSAQPVLKAPDAKKKKSDA